MDKLLKFFPLVKVDVAQRLVYGLVTAEAEDKDGEICEYASTKPEYEKVNAELGKASDGQNIMPLREMHQLNAVGAGKSIEFDDAHKQIKMAFKVVDDSTWKKVCEKVLLGFSQGGRYLKRWTEGSKKYYTAQPGEVSLVDNPCLPGAFIEVVKADGSVEMYKTPEQKLTDADVERITKALEASLVKKESRSAKSLLDELAKWENLGDSELDTQLKHFHAQITELMGKQSATGAKDMKPEDIKKCAAALGISEDDFKKQFAASDDLSKAKKGLAALHGHMEAAMEHHDAMHKAHTSLGAMHEKMSGHLGKCMKACKDVMGSDEKEAEKALKALLDELRPVADDAAAKAAAAARAAATNSTDDKISKADAEKMVQDAIKKAMDAQLEPPAARLFTVTRDGDVRKAEQLQASDPLPV